MATIGFIGSGQIGATTARLAIDAGHDVVLSNSRDPDTLWPLAVALGPAARPAEAREAAAAGDVVVVTIPLGKYGALPADALREKIIIDTCNYYPDRDGAIDELDGGATTSGLLQSALPGARVVKGLNNIWFHHLRTLARPTGAPDRNSLPIAGDDDEAKATVSRLFDELGHTAYDTGSLADSWRFERDQPAYVWIYGQVHDFDGAPTRVTDDALAAALARAQPGQAPDVPVT